MTTIRRLRAALMLLWCCSMLALSVGGARADGPLEASVKAAYLYKFLGYVEWPAGAFAGPDAALQIGVAGADAVHAELTAVVQGRSLQSRPLVVRRLAEGDPVDGLHVLFVGPGIKPHGPWLQSLRGKPVLVVTDTPPGLAMGGMLNFVLVQGRVRFEASVPAAERSGLRLSSRLLAVAERVVATP